MIPVKQLRQAINMPFHTWKIDKAQYNREVRYQGKIYKNDQHTQKLHTCIPSHKDNIVCPYLCCIIMALLGK